MSKGSRQRPIANKQKFDENWDMIFKKGSDGIIIDQPKTHKELTEKALEDALVDLSKNPKKYIRKTYAVKS